MPVFRVKSSGPLYSCFKLSNNSFISKHLTRLELCHVAFGESPLDLLGSQALEVLDIDDYSINLGDILPKSLRHLKIRDSSLSATDRPRNCLSAPGLVTFELADCFRWTPLLESLPLLVTSFIRISYCTDACSNYMYLGDCGKDSCDGCYAEDDCCVLEGLSGAMNLELLNEWSLVRLFFW